MARRAGTEFFVSPRDELAVITLSQQMPMVSIKSAIRPLVYGAIKDRTATRKSARASTDGQGALARSRDVVLDARIVDSAAIHRPMCERLPLPSCERVGDPGLRDIR